MEYVSRIISLLGELALLVRALFTDGTHFISLLARSRSALAAENLFLRKQLAFYQERKIQPQRFDNASRFMLVLLSHGFAWKEGLVNVTPKTFIGWHRAGFRLFWRWKSRPGRPRIPAELRTLIREMALSNVFWGEERIVNVTTHSTAAWTLQQLLEATPSDHRYRFLIHARPVHYAHGSSSTQDTATKSQGQQPL